MTSSNYDACLAFVWKPGYDDPTDGYHVTPGDPGGGTKGGVIEATWASAYDRGLVAGSLEAALPAQLSAVLRDGFWGPACDALPSGVDLVLFNGRMMTGAFPRIFQRCLGMMGDDVDGQVGPKTVVAAVRADPATLVAALAGSHYAYLASLPTWSKFGGGWSKRVLDVRDTALRMTSAASAARAS